METEYPQHPRSVKLDAEGGLLIDIDRGEETKLYYDWYRRRDTLRGDSYHGVADEGSATSIVISPVGIDVATDLEMADDGNVLSQARRS